MARPKEFERDSALEAAIGVFRDHGFEGSSTGMLLAAMGIGRQSFYDTFGDKQKLYAAALERYARDEAHKHLSALKTGGRGLDAIAALLDGVIARADEPCLGVGSISEFGCRDAEVNAINAAADRVLQQALMACLEDAATDGTLADGVVPEEAARFVVATIASLRLSARGGAAPASLNAIRRLAMRALIRR
ncbi:TetR/AcrR family transcriptional regulator [Pararhodobacter zhoushanensis]|uniref:TetR/AcrR family transcriptional regulator n=1 Tax=Pararhodobacter zhoushanensis TaxID=2479545 RepID=UPI000F8EBE8D|nr:TetR/AcrR family transcriptional regulator [Pararhodobacter zhoushanensis]